MFFMTEFCVCELVEIIPVTYGGGLNSVYYTRDGVGNYDPIKTDVIYVCRKIKDLVYDITNKDYFKIVDSLYNPLIHLKIQDIKCSFKEENFYEHYITKKVDLINSENKYIPYYTFLKN